MHLDVHMHIPLALAAPWLRQLASWWPLEACKGKLVLLEVALWVPLVAVVVVALLV